MGNRSLKPKYKKKERLRRKREVLEQNRRCKLFPSEDRLKQQWITKINRQDWAPKKYTKICSSHFNDEDFRVTKKGLTKLKKGTIPCLKLNISPPTKYASTSSTNEVNPKENIECRTCLRDINSDDTFFNIFEGWPEYVKGSSETIAKDLAVITKIELVETDPHSKIICLECYTSLNKSVGFAAKVRSNDNILKQRHKESQTEEIRIHKDDTIKIEEAASDEEHESDGGRTIEKVRMEIDEMVNNEIEIKLEAEKINELILQFTHRNDSDVQHLTLCNRNADSDVQNLTLSQRNTIIFMYEQHVPISEISKILEIAEETVDLWIRNYPTGTIDSLPPSLFTKRANATFNIFECQERVQFAVKYKDFDWMNNVVIFTSMICVVSETQSNQPRLLWKKKNHTVSYNLAQESEEKINLSYLGWFSSMGPGELVPIKNLAVGENFLDTFKNAILPSVRVAYPHEHVYFMHDNSSVHSTTVENWLCAQDNVSVITWPSKYADLNSMENIWEYIIFNQNPALVRTNTDLDKLIHSSWGSFRGNKIWWHMVTNMNERLKAVIDSEGDSINKL